MTPQGRSRSSPCRTFSSPHERGGTDSYVLRFWCFFVKLNENDDDQNVAF